MLTNGTIVINRYRIIRLLGQGGMGTIYQAWDAQTNQKCVLKEYLHEGEEVSPAFNIEAGILHRLKHPGLPTVQHQFRVPIQADYLVLEHLEGDSVQSVLKKNCGPFPLGQALTWILQVCDAVIYLHGLQPPVIHNAIQPGNIFKTSSGNRVILMEFGASSLHMKGGTPNPVQLVSPGYSPPEQYGRMTDERSDIYALGATLYTLLTDQEPTDSTDRGIGKELALLHELNPDIPPDIETAVMRAMELKPEKRFQRVEELKATLQGLQIPASAVSAPAESSTSKRICLNCGAGLRSTSRFCPCCGIPIPLQETASMAINVATQQQIKPPESSTGTPPAGCPTCGHHNLPDVIYCSNCGAQILEAENVILLPLTATAVPLAEAGSVQPSDNGGIFYCSTCGAGYSPGQDVCRDCGRPLPQTSGDDPPAETGGRKKGTTGNVAPPRMSAVPAPPPTIKASDLPDIPTPRAAPVAAFAPVQGNAQPPIPITDKVSFTLTAPQGLLPGNAHVLDVWAHLPSQRRNVLKLAQQALGLQKVEDLLAQSKMGIPVARGNNLTCRLWLPDGFILRDNEDTIFWDGEIGNARFIVQVAPNLAPRSYDGVVTFSIEQICIARLSFCLQVGKKTKPAVEEARGKTQWTRSAFASYAHEDRQAVIARIQGIQKANSRIDVFMDVISLRSGDNWQKRIRQEIAKRDVFYLFWSKAASQSPWVEMEWHAALETRGLNAIDPIPLQPGSLAPPPAELASLHFDDPLLHVSQ